MDEITVANDNGSTLSLAYQRAVREGNLHYQDIFSAAYDALYDDTQPSTDLLEAVQNLAATYGAVD